MSKKKDEQAEQKSVLRSAMIQPTAPLHEESRGIPAWVSVLLCFVGGAVLVFGLVRLVHFAWYF